MKILTTKYAVPQKSIQYRSGIMGVPITFMTKYNPNQFEVVGKIDAGEITKYNLGLPIINGVSKFKRIAIRRIIHEY